MADTIRCGHTTTISNKLPRNQSNMATSMNASDGDGKRKIKKLTKEKLEQFHDEIVRPRGQVDLSGRGIEAIVSLDGLRAATKIDLSHNALTKLSELKRVPNTTMLKLTGNKLNGEVCRTAFGAARLWMLPC